MSASNEGSSHLLTLDEVWNVRWSPNFMALDTASVSNVFRTDDPYAVCDAVRSLVNSGVNRIVIDKETNSMDLNAE